MKKINSGILTLAYLGISTNEQVFYNLGSAQLVEAAVSRRECVLSATGAMIVETGIHTGRSPKDKYIVNNGTHRDAEIAWGSVNKSISPVNFERIYQKVIKYLCNKQLFIQDVTAGHHFAHAKTFRVITEYAWAALFARNLLIPSSIPVDMTPDFTVIHTPSFLADPEKDGTTTGTFIIIDYERHVVLIGDSSYAGEIKKAVFTVMNRILPSENVLPMHCSANIGKSGDTALFFGLSGTGKTTLSSSPDRSLIGDDEHGWGDDGIFNFENGCYAKTINLSKEFEPLIWDASQRFGSVLENVGFDNETRVIDFSDNSKTENTRAAYPLSYIPSHVDSGLGQHPRNIFFLSADAFGVLPPIANLTNEQAVYYFLLGYTAKLAGTEKGLGAEPEATFSTCFGEPFLPLSPGVYASMLHRLIEKHKPNVWLINTGWSGGQFGVGNRMKLPYSRAMINYALANDSGKIDYQLDSAFKLKIPLRVDGVPSDVLDPINTWADKDDFLNTARTLINKMAERMKIYKGLVNESILTSGPQKIG